MVVISWSTAYRKDETYLQIRPNRWVEKDVTRKMMVEGLEVLLDVAVRELPEESIVTIDDLENIVDNGVCGQEF